MDRVEIVHQNLCRRLAAGDLPDGPAPRPGLTEAQALVAFRAQCQSRALDRTARVLQAAGKGFYTIGSSGHEGMAAVALAARLEDVALLHYRDAAFQLARATQLPGQDPVWDMLLSFTASSEDPISGGRHKVLGSRALNIPPQTSTIASHLPKAVGIAYSQGLARRHPPEHRQLAEDAVVLCSFGDASLNHSTAQGALNAASWAAYQSVPLPLLWICEDNGIGISTPTPAGWVAANLQQRPALEYFSADGCDVYATYAAASEAVAYVRQRRRPAVLHLRMVRLYGHAGADVPSSYLSRQQIEADEARDPLLHSARLLAQASVLSPADALSLYEAVCAEVEARSLEASERPRLSSATGVMRSIVPPERACVAREPADDARREHSFGSDWRGRDEPQTLARLINWTLTDLMLEHPEIVLAGEDIGRKGGVYGVTLRLQSRFGADRVIDTLLDEQSILGLAIGLAHNGFLPIPEIQFLAYLHNAEDQLRGEAATLSFFSNGQYSNPLLVRIAGLGYQRGFGGHFHNDNSVAVLRDIPGLILACPSNAHDAALLLRECLRLVREEQRVVVFLEPIALYAMRDLHQASDAAWMCRYPAPERRAAFGEVAVHDDGTDLAIVSYGNGYYLSRRAQPLVEAKGARLRVIDLRWLAPLPEDSLLRALSGCQRVLVVDECRRSGSVSEALVALLVEHDVARVARVTATDSFIATGPAYAATLPSVESIVDAALALLDTSR